jgi:hypothetical protein
MSEAHLRAFVASIAQPIYKDVPGAPVCLGDEVVVLSVDDTGNTELVGCVGTVRYLEYSCGCGQSYPDFPMIGVQFADGTVEEFWPEEIATSPRVAGYPYLARCDV